MRTNPISRSDKAAVLATATLRNDVVFSVVFVMLVTKGQQLGIRRVPINLIALAAAVSSPPLTLSPRFAVFTVAPNISAFCVLN